MNATQPRPSARLADLSPFFITVQTREHLPLLRDAVCGEPHKGGAQRDSDYGCVDWYQYPVIKQSRARQQRNLG